MLKRGVTTALLTVLFAGGFLLSVVLSFILHNSEPNGCDMSWSYPSYVDFKQFKSRHSPAGNKKYGLRMYREGGPFWIPFDAAHDKPTGVPILFIPGNAGSANQVRSIASYFAQKSHLNSSLPQFDVYVVDLHEDFTAFHGFTLLDQAKYVNDAVQFIRSLYKESMSVILIGHSMGGMVARAILTLPTYEGGSVATIVTLSTPHLVPALTFDKDIVATYDQVNSYWRDMFWGDKTGEFRDVVLISIAGGQSDHMVPSDYAAVSSIVPESNGFSTFTYSIPGVWTSVDHLAMAWCHQLRRAVCDAMYGIVDARNPSKTLPVAKRVGIFRDALLYDRWENIQNSTKMALAGSEHMDMDLPAAMDQYLPLREFEQGQVELYSLPQLADELAILYDSTLVYLCDSSSGRCRNIESDTRWLPQSLPDSKYAFETNDHPYLRLAIYSPLEVEGFDSLLVKSDSGGFVASAELQHMVVDRSWWQLLVGTNVSLNGLFTGVHLPRITSGLLSYKVTLLPQPLDSAIKQPFEPILRHVSKVPIEAKTFVNIRSAVVSFHGSAPYIPLDGEHQGLQLQVFAPSPDRVLQIRWDAWASMGNIALRYRLFPISVSLATSLVVVGWLQMVPYLRGISVPSYGQALTLFTRQSLPILCLITMGAHVALTYTQFATTYFLGTREVWAALLLPTFLVTGSAFNYLVYFLALFIQAGARKIVGRREPWKPSMVPRVWANPPIYWLMGISGLGLVVPYQCLHLFICIWQLVLSATIRDTRANLITGLAIINLWTAIIHSPIWAVWARNCTLWWSTLVINPVDVVHILGLALLSYVLRQRGIPNDRPRLGVSALVARLFITIALCALCGGPVAIASLPRLINWVGYLVAAMMGFLLD
jgi:pimeloyl-ACP methyl ester carboxylesterase